MKEYLSFIKKNKTRYLQELKEYIAIPSISADKVHKNDIKRAATWIAGRMKKAGLLNVRLIHTKGNPAVYGEWIHDKDKPTVLFYGHYDVQPPDPLDQWESKPFEMSEREGILYGRGVADNKAPHLSHIIGIEAMFLAEKELPVNIRFLVEGEEEIGSAHFARMLNENRKLLKSDFAFVSDGIMVKDAPVIEYGLRGLVGFEINVRCLKKDVHSGSFGGVVDNAPMVLAYIISQLKDRNGRIRIPGIYSRVRKVGKEEMSIASKADTSSKEIIGNTGAKLLFGEKDFRNVIRTGARPSLDVNGIFSGYTGDGMKTIIPAEATAKMSMRIIPHLTAEYVQKQIVGYVKRIAPKTCEVKIKFQGGGDPVLFELQDRKYQLVSEALKETFGRKPKFKLVGGSVGAVTDMKQILGMDSIFTGFALPDCGMHSPNEKLPVENFLKGVELTIRYLKKLA
ncbi:MAG: M20/M25/M40 family metallo-hydrolase [Candidatus Dojkabacteria bacterium]|nr:M20/M25/M40 family metallo-hydrolase [Candidatus Dojkabacteria bacterium]